MTGSEYIILHMRIGKNRHLTILYTLIHSQDVFVSSEQLAEKTMSSVRTVKSDIAMLAGALKEENIAVIESRRSQGYRLIPLDEKQFAAFEESVQIHRILFQYRSIEEMNRRLYILQNQLAYGSIKIDDLADKLYVSRSSLTKDMAWASKFLNSHHIQVKSVPGKGLCISGQEQEIRTAMVEVFCSQYHDIELLYPVDAFTDLFETDLYEDIRHEMLKVIRESELTISDLSAKKIATYLILVPQRLKEGKGLNFSNDMKQELLSSYEHEVAEKILKQKTVRKTGITDENEILNLTRLLLVNKDIDLRNTRVPSHISPELYRETEDLLTEMNQYFRKENSSLFSSSLYEQYCSDLLSVLLKLQLQRRFDHLDSRHFISYTETGENNYSPAALEYTRQVIGFLEEKYRQKIRRPDLIREFSSVFHYILKQIPFDIRKMRLAVFSTEGRTTAELLRDELRKQWGNYIEKADVFNLYEMRRISFNDYDYAVSSWDVAYYSYPVPLVSFRGMNPSEDKKKLFDDLFVHCFNEETVNEMNRLLRIFEHTEMDDYMTLINALADQYGRNEKHARKIAEKAVNRFSAVSYYNPGSSISMIFLDYSDTRKEVFDVYVPDGSVYWGTDMEIHCFIVVCLKPDLPLSKLRTADQILQVLWHEREQTDRLIEEGGPFLAEIFRMVLKNNFL